MLAKYSCHSLQRLELAGLGPSIFNEESKTICFNSTFDSMSSLTNLKVYLFLYWLVILVNYLKIFLEIKFRPQFQYLQIASSSVFYDSTRNLSFTCS
jgi:hypothetical protein